MNALVPFRNTDLALIRKTVAKDCDQQEFDMFIHIAKAIGLDPLRRQIYAFVFGKDKGEGERQLTVVTGIDGYRTISDRTGNYRPDNQPPRYTYDDALKSPTNPHGIETCEVSVFKYSHGEWHEAPGLVYWDEFVPTGYRKEDVLWEDKVSKNGKPYKKKSIKEGAVPVVDPSKTGWVKMGRNQIAKCAEAQAHRKAFPNDFAGVLVEEEVHRRMSEDLTASEMADQVEKEDRLARIGGPDTYIIDWMDGGELQNVTGGRLADQVMAFVATCEGQPSAIKAFRDRNRVALQQFWANHKSDALALRNKLDEAEKKAMATDQVDLEDAIASQPAAAST
jgi:phage recombination protein Bet